jgi:hypothetical protein
MISNFLKCIAAVLTLGVAHAQSKPEVKAPAKGRVVNIKLVYLTKSEGDLGELYFATDKGGTLKKGTPSASVAVDSVPCWVESSGRVVFTKTAESSDVEATAAVGEDVKSAIVFFHKNLKQTGTDPYQTLVVNDDSKKFPNGSSFVCNLSNIPLRIKIGDVETELAPDNSAYVDQPKGRDEYNLATVLVSKKDGEDWSPVKDSMHRFADTERYFIFLTPTEEEDLTVKVYKQPVPSQTLKKAK